MQDPVIVGSALCPRPLEGTNWKELLERVEKAGVWKVESRWMGGHPAGPEVLVKTKDSSGRTSISSVNVYVGEGGEEERAVVRALNDVGLCSPRPPG
jgi:hypothetical protein